jgi:hypothetical protein
MTGPGERLLVGKSRRTMASILEISWFPPCRFGFSGENRELGILIVKKLVLVPPPFPLVDNNIAVWEGGEGGREGVPRVNIVYLL